jgi:hypothetical protein
MYMLITLVIFVGALVYGFIQFQELSQVMNAIEEGKAQSVQLNSAVDKYSEAYAEQKKAFDEDFVTVLDSIEGVFPSEENYTAINYLLDEFQTENNTSLNPVFISNVSYGKGKIEEDYAVLPFTLSLTASRDNFEKFLRFIFNSGSLDERTRLMSIQAISIDFPKEASAFQTATPTQSDQISVSIALYAYFQIPPEVNIK